MIKMLMVLLMSVSANAAVELTPENTAEKLTKTWKNDRVAVIEFYADWCEACKTLEPVYAKTEKELISRGFKLDFYRSNTDTNPELAEPIRSIPTIIVLKYKGQRVRSLTGIRPDVRSLISEIEKRLDDK